MSGNRSHQPEFVVNPHWLGYRCGLCGLEHDPDHPGFVCRQCGNTGILDLQYDYPAIQKTLVPGQAFSPQPAGAMWRFKSLLPICPDAPHPAWSLGGTPILRSDNLATALGLSELFIKDDTGLPSASLKDRASAMAIARASQLGNKHLACASTGNAAASLAMLTARTDLSCTIYLPANAPEPKLAQLLLHGAELVRVPGNYDQAYDLCVSQVDKQGWFSRNCAHNSFLVEGKKTAALELLAAMTDEFQTGDLGLPTAIFVPVGDGCIVSSVAKACWELRQLGLIGRVPRIFGVQAAGAAPLAGAWQEHPDPYCVQDGAAVQDLLQPVQATTLADSIRVGIPRNGLKAWRYVAASSGGFLTVSDEEILAAVGKLAALAGVFAEPAAAAGVAGITSALAKGWIDPADRVAVLVTGHGLKDPAAALTD